MKKLLKIISGIVIVLVLAVPAVVQAGAQRNQLCPDVKPPDMSQDAFDKIRASEACAFQYDPIAGPGGLISDVTNIVAVAAGIAAVVMIMVGGYKFITSTGDSSKVQEAKKTIMWSVIGLVVIVLARSIIVFVLERV